MVTNFLALDVGTVRIGAARANSIARLPSPLPIITNDDQVINSIKSVLDDEQINVLIVGLPRGLDGQETEQTKYVQTFVDQLNDAIDMPVHLQDEALTSVKAEAELKQRGSVYSKGDIDSLSAVYILEDFLAEGVN